MSYKGRIDWRGLLVDHVGTHYRNVPSSTPCPLCRQLHAPWIQPFLKKLDPMRWLAKDLGNDRIHIFQHLRHLPHVNDFPTARKVLREHDAPYHIAVVPSGYEWRDELQAHIALEGMVVVMPKGVQESKLFVPQQVSEKFKPNVVIPWLKFCKGHKKLCDIAAPEVKGMKVIDCDSNDLIIRDYHSDDKYVALSYVWGKPAPSETATSAPAAKETPQREDTMEVKPKGPQLVARNPPHVPKSKWDLVQKKSVPKRVTAEGVKKTHRAAAAPEGKPASGLPKDIPLTIQDAIWVTKALGYRFLWVDKYCIDQDNESEKRQQCGLMGPIYAGSQITIFALGPDSNYGLPGVSSRPRFQQRQSTTIERYEFVSTMLDPQLSITQSVWSTRGWTYQEGLFSTRRLFFTDYQVYFECNAMNCAESFKSNLGILHIRSGQRFRAYHRAGKFVCGNSNQYSHLNVSRSKENHRKVDTIRRCQYQIQQYSTRELTNKDDVLNAFAGIARFYARTTAKIVSLAGIPIPFPIANLRDTERERLDHLTYALAWTHRILSLGGPNGKDPSNQSGPTRERVPWTLHGNPEPQPREGFPSWSWAGWFGEIGKRHDLPYCWTSYLSSLRIGFRGGDSEDYVWLKRFNKYEQYLIQKLLTANVLHFDAYVLNPKKLKFWKSDPHMPSRQIPSDTIRVYLSKGPCSLEELHRKLMDGVFVCVVLGTYGKPRKDIFKAIQVADKKRRKARNRRIDLFERGEPDAIVCLIVHTVKGTSRRIGLLKIVLEGSGRDFTLQAWDLDLKRNFILV
jgi:Heterokaryon incompatibility protein (HET)